VISNLFWLCNAIDKTVTINHSRSAYVKTERSIEVLLLLNNLVSLGQDYELVLSKLESELNPALVKHGSNTIFVDSVVLVFEDNSLTAVTLLDNLTSEEFNKLEK